MDKQRTAKFWSHIDRDTKTGCWLWRAGKTGMGYGAFLVDGKLKYAHRIAWELLKGSIPAGLNVLHNCPTGDNPLCCNPAHLFLGTQGENNTDRARKMRGNKNKLTADQVTEIYALRGKLTPTEMARKVGISRTVVWNIWHGKAWRWLTGAQS